MRAVHSACIGSAFIALALAPAPPELPGGRRVAAGPAAVALTCPPATPATLPLPQAAPANTVSPAPLSPGALALAVTPVKDRVGSSSPAFDLVYDASPQVFLYPQEAAIKRSIEVRNLGAYAELGFSVTVSGPPGSSVQAQPIAATFPQGPVLFLQPGESQFIHVSVSWGELDTGAFQAGLDREYRLQLRIWRFDPNDPQGGAGTAAYLQVATLSNMARITALRADDIPKNATITGCVYDAVTRAPIANAFVAVQSSTMGYRGSTNAVGAFELPIVAHQRVVQQVWVEYGLQVSATGYADFHAVFAPHGGDTLRLDVPLQRPPTALAYEVTSKYQTSLNLNQGARSLDGHYIGLTHAHSEIPPGVNPATFLGQAQFSFFEKTGSRLWQFPLFAESYVVDVSDDGTLVAAARTNLARGDDGIYVLNTAGETVWHFQDSMRRSVGRDEFRVARFSHSGHYLVAGDREGHLFLLDVVSKTRTWVRYLNGNVRSVAFEADDSRFYVGSGDGYLYAFTLDGTPVWRSYVDSWADALEISPHYIFLATKLGQFVHLLNKSGQILWSYPVAASPRTAIAPDESFFVAATSAAGVGAMIFTPDGRVEARRNQAAGGEFPGAGVENVSISADNRLVLLSGQTIGANDIGTVRLMLVNRQGQPVWSTSLDTTHQRGPANMGGLTWVSPDLTEMNVANGDWMYFLRQIVGPRGLTATVAGNHVTLSWTPGARAGTAGYQLEAGTVPGAPSIVLPVGNVTTFGTGAPTGMYYVRVREMATGLTSDEIQLFVNVPAPPGAPTSLVGTAIGNRLALTWQNATSGGSPTAILLDVSGAIATTLSLPVSQSFSFVGVPTGTYVFAVRARNDTGTSGASNSVTLTFPGACQVPAAPANFTATKSGSTITVSWAATSGATGYLLTVSGAYTGTIPTTGLTLSGSVGPGSYTLSVAATNECGLGPATATQTVTIP